jgi:DivIVA domain-containing protein
MSNGAQPPYDGGGAPFAHSGAPMPQPTLTAVQVRAMRFPRPPSGSGGYNEQEVDAFLEQVASALAGRGRLTADEVHGVVFTSARPGRHGYDPHRVDAFLDQVERQLRMGKVASTRLRGGQDLRAARLPRASHGYDSAEVDAFLDRAAATLDGQGTMTSSEVFRTRFSSTSGLRRGYRVAAVDSLLDELEQELRSRGR